VVEILGGRPKRWEVNSRQNVLNQEVIWELIGNLRLIPVDVDIGGVSIRMLRHLLILRHITNLLGAIQGPTLAAAQ